MSQRRMWIAGFVLVVCCCLAAVRGCQRETDYVGFNALPDSRVFSSDGRVADGSVVSIQRWAASGRVPHLPIWTIIPEETVRKALPADAIPDDSKFWKAQCRLVHHDDWPIKFPATAQSFNCIPDVSLDGLVDKHGKSQKVTQILANVVAGHPVPQEYLEKRRPGFLYYRSQVPIKVKPGEYHLCCVVFPCATRRSPHARNTRIPTGPPVIVANYRIEIGP